jgi:Family of unknown function (DUF5640)
VKKPWIVVLLVVFLLAALSFALAGCGGDEDTDDALLGVWTDPSGVMELEFQSDGVLIIRVMDEEEQGTYTAKDGMLSAIDPETGEPEEVTYTIEGDTLMLGPNGEEGTLTRQE